MIWFIGGGEAAPPQSVDPPPPAVSLPTAECSGPSMSAGVGGQGSLWAADL